MNIKKRSILFLVFLVLIVITTGIAWGDGTGTGGGTNPFYPDKTYQGFALQKMSFAPESSSTDEYYVYPIYGVDATDGVGTLYKKRPDGSNYLSTKAAAFLDANEVQFDLSTQQYNTWPVYTYNNFPFILTAGVQGDSSYALVQPTPNGALYLTNSQVMNYWNGHTWLINPSEIIPSTGLGAAPGWKTTFTFIAPDLQAQTVYSGAPATGAIVGGTYYASAHFYMNYKMLGYSNVRLYQERSDGTKTQLTQQSACFGKYGSFDLNGVAWTMDSSTIRIWASVGERWDNSTMSWIKEGYSNAYVAWSGDKADKDWSNNINSAGVITGLTPPPPSGGGGASNLVADSVTYDKNQQIATAKFHSTFPVGGTATVRIYSNSMAGGTSITQVGDPQVMHIDANGSIQATDLFFISDGATLYATIDLTYDGVNWNGSKFASSTGNQDETTYEDNKTSCVIGNPPVTPPPQPAANDEIHPASYHPVVQVPHYHNETYQEWVDNWDSVPFYPDNSKPKLHVYLISLLVPPAYASEHAMTYVTINGNSVYGYWLDANGTQIFIECDSTGNEIRAWINKGSFVTKTRQVLDGYTTQQDMSKTTYLYSPECWFGPEWKGTINLAPAWSFFGSVTPLKVTSPYGSLPETWRWVVSEYDNESPFPVMANVQQSLSAGESYNGRKYFGPGEQKFLLLKLNSTLPVSTGNMLGTCAYVNINYDPQAPTTPVNYVNNPPADDCTGTVWTAHLYQGISISNDLQYGWYAGGIWGLVPCFKEVPVWNPEPGDPKWGTLSFQSVPAWEWTTVAGCQHTGNNPYHIDYVPDTPYIVPGSYGDETLYLPQGGYSISRVQSDILTLPSSYSGLVPDSSGTISKNDLSNFLLCNWGIMDTGRVYDFNSWVYTLSGGTVDLYVSQDENTVVKTYPIYGDSTNVKWYKYHVIGKSTQYNYHTEVPSDGVWTDISNETDWSEGGGSNPPCVIRNRNLYKPIYGSYEQIQSISHDNSSRHYINGCTVQHHAMVYNPSDQPVQFIMTKGLQNGDTYYYDFYTIPGAAQGWVTLQPHSYTELTSIYSLPQSTYQPWYGGVVPKEWFTDLSWSNHPVANDFVPGSCRPVNRMYEWQMSGLQSNMVGYDWGNYVLGSSGYSFYTSPGLCGGYIDMERDMTPTEMNYYLSRAGWGSYVIDSTAAQKAREIIANGGTTTWGMKSVLYYKNHDGWYPYTTLVP